MMNNCFLLTYNKWKSSMSSVHLPYSHNKIFKIILSWTKTVKFDLNKCSTKYFLVDNEYLENSMFVFLSGISTPMVQTMPLIQEYGIRLLIAHYLKWMWLNLINTYIYIYKYRTVWTFKQFLRRILYCYLNGKSNKHKLIICNVSGETLRSLFFLIIWNRTRGLWQRSSF